MALGFNRYALLVALLTAGSISAAGCSGGGGSSGGGFQGTTSSAATTTSSSTTAPTTTATTPVGVGPGIISVALEDVDGDGRASKGDRIHVAFNDTLALKGTAVDPAKELALAVQGDSFGAGATCAIENQSGVAITLGEKPVLRVSGDYNMTVTTPGSASGLDAAKTASGIVRKSTGAPIASNGFMDLGGSLKMGFKQGPALVAARGLCQAVTLDDGRVLVVGGLRGGDNYAEDAEIYDPLTNQFTQVRDISGPQNGRMLNGSVVVRRINFTATKLADGRVLVAGGYGITKRGLFGFGKEKLETIATAHLFDPKTNTFKKVGDMDCDRHSHTATLLADGRVLIAGGYSDSWWSRKKTETPFEAFNPKTEKFEDYHHWLILTNKLKEARELHSAVAVDGGQKVLLAGGEHWEGGWLHWFGTNTLKMNKSSEVFSAQKNETTKSGDMKHARRRHAADLLGTGEVVVVGGDDDKGVVGSIETWSPNSNAWTERGNLKTPRTNARVASFEGQTFVVGGFSFGGAGKNDVKSVEVYDAAAGALAQGSYDMAQERNSCAVAKLQDGRLLVIGGFVGSNKNVQGCDGQALGTTEIFSRP